MRTEADQMMPHVPAEERVCSARDVLDLKPVDNRLREALQREHGHAKLGVGSASGSAVSLRRTDERYASVNDNDYKLPPTEGSGHERPGAGSSTYSTVERNGRAHNGRGRDLGIDAWRLTCFWVP